VVVSEAGPNAVSSYDLVRGDVLDLRTGSAPTNQSATCWVRLTRDGQFAFAVNAGSASLSGFDVGADGKLTPVSPAVPTGALPAGSAPLDLDVTEDNHFVFALEAGSGGIGGFAIGPHGTLTVLPGAAGAVAPASGAEGLAAF
jgi:6-phosphogluconolactonase (cycloisomerase 2 family)